MLFSNASGSPCGLQKRTSFAVDVASQCVSDRARAFVFASISVFLFSYVFFSLIFISPAYGQTSDTNAESATSSPLNSQKQPAPEKQPMAATKSAADWNLFMAEGKGLWSKRDYNKALEIFMQCERLARVEGPQSPELCETLYYLGDCSKYLCKYDAAEKYMLERLPLLEKQSSDARQLPICYSELASVLKRQGRLDESVRYYEKGLTALNESDRNGITGATTLDNMGIVLQMQSKWSDAVKAHEEALKIYEKASGVEEIDKLYCLGNLGQAFFGNKEFEKAEALMIRALEGVKKLEGADSLPSATFSDNLGCFYYRRGDCKHALEFQEIALKNFQKNLGAEHPEVAICLENIAHTYVCLDRKDKAIQCVQRALGINMKVLGADHPSTRGSRKFLQELSAIQEQDKIDPKNSPDA